MHRDQPTRPIRPICIRLVRPNPHPESFAGHRPVVACRRRLRTGSPTPSSVATSSPALSSVFTGPPVTSSVPSSNDAGYRRLPSPVTANYHQSPNVVLESSVVGSIRLSVVGSVQFPVAESVRFGSGSIVVRFRFHPVAGSTRFPVAESIQSPIAGSVRFPVARSA